MPSANPAFRLAEVHSARWSRITLWFVLGVLVLLPAAYGGVEAWSQLVALAAATLLAGLVLARAAFDPLFQFPRAPAALALALGWLALIAVQLIPLSPDLHATVHPRAQAARDELRALPPLAQDATPTQETVTWHAPATEHGLRMALLAVVLLGVCACSVQREPDAQFLLWGIFLIGVAEAILGLAQHATGARAIYWLDAPATGRAVTAGSFVNYSHFCQFVNLALGCGVGLLLWQLERDRRGYSVQMWDRWTALTTSREARYLLGGGICLAAVAVLTSMGRNGALSLLATAMVGGLLLSLRESLSWRRWLLVALPLLVLGVLLLSGFDLVYARLATLQEQDPLGDRWQLTQGVLQSWRRNPVLGAGLSTHQYVFPQFDRTATLALAEHADNDYAQLLEETGVVGFGLVGLAVCLLGWRIYRLIRYGQTAASIAAYGLLMGLLAILVQSATDFGQHLPAIFGLTAAVAGLVLGLTHLEERHAAAAAPLPSLIISVRRRLLLALLALPLFAALGWAVHGAYRNYLGESWDALTGAVAERIEAEPAKATDDDYYDLLAAAEGAVEIDPRQLRRQFVLQSARWRSLSRFRDPDTGELLVHPDAVPFVAKIADDIAALRQQAPTYGPFYGLEGELRYFVLEEPAGKTLIQTAARLAPNDAEVNFRAGDLAADDARAAEGANAGEARTLALKFLRRAALLDPRLFVPAADVLVNRLSGLAEAKELAQNDFGRLVELAKLCAAKPPLATEADGLRAAATALLQQRIEQNLAASWEFAELARLTADAGDRPAAISLYSKALTREYGRADWRYNLALLLREEGRLKDALREARLCLRTRPGFAEAQKLADELAVEIPPE